MRHEHGLDPNAVAESRLGVANVAGLNHDVLLALLIRGVGDLKGEDIVSRAVRVLVDKELERGGRALGPFTIADGVGAREASAEVVVVPEAAGSILEHDGSRGVVSAVEARDGDDRGGVLEEGVGRDRHRQGVVRARPGGALANNLGAEEGLVNLEGLGISLGRELAVAGSVGSAEVLLDGAGHLGARGTAEHSLLVLVHRVADTTVATERGGDPRLRVFDCTNARGGGAGELQIIISSGQPGASGGSLVEDVLPPTNHVVADPSLDLDVGRRVPHDGVADAELHDVLLVGDSRLGNPHGKPLVDGEVRSSSVATRSVPVSVAASTGRFV
mmetsp:Transcript_6053/g.14565  ORF Transcript_6053/g.14565 Transcript_6053/m.14565 type:complete len:330 (-) Transcript_6053:1082-2071(-)